MIKRFTIIALFSLFTLVYADDSLQQDWQAMHATKSQALEQFNDYKFGMFIHWGVYSMPAGIWNGEKIPGLGEWIFYHAQIPRAEYKQLCSQFNPVKFDAKAWVKLAKDAGMRYVIAMPKHHDGFAMYDSKVTDYDIIDSTPFDIDPIKALSQECEKQGLRFGIYYSHSTDWMDGGNAGVLNYLKENPDDTSKWADWPANMWDPSPVSFEEYLEVKSKPQMVELLNSLPNLIEIWYDMANHMTREQSFEFYKLVYDIQPNCLVNSRVGNDWGDYWVTGDNKIPDDGEGGDVYWEAPGTLNNTWGYKSYDVDWKSTKELIYWIMAIASKGGNYLLNIGPKGDGSIPQESIDQLHKIGEWMSINSEAVYGTHSWHVTHEGPTKIEIKSTTQRKRDGFRSDFQEQDFWFTQKDNNLYIMALVWPEDGTVTIKSLSPQMDYAPEIKNISLLGSEQKIAWKQTSDGLTIQFPAKRISEYGYVLRTEMK